MSMLRFLKNKNITFAVLGNNVIDATDDLHEHDVVFADDIQGAYDMTQYLISLGTVRLDLWATSVYRGLRVVSAAIGGDGRRWFSSFGEQYRL